MLTIYRLTCIALLFTSSLSWGWGHYCHQQTNYEAAQDLADSDLGRCLVRNIELIKRLAVSPDFDWKFSPFYPPEDRSLIPLAKANNRLEHETHFWEPDAFSGKNAITVAQILALPSGPFTDVVARFGELLAPHREWVREVNPRRSFDMTKEKALPIEVADTGTAPWRIRDLWERGVAAMAREDYTMALIYLGTMGHYVGDLSQPLHVTINYDGQYPKSDGTKGIHAVLDSDLMHTYAKEKNAKYDSHRRVWNTFSPTHDGVRAAMGKYQWGKANEALTKDEIVANSMRLAGSSYSYARPLQALFKETLQGVKLREGERGFPIAVLREFREKKRVTDFEHGGADLTVRELILKRVGASASLLSKLWASAYQAARAQNAEVVRIRNCEAMAFDQSLLIRRYPEPEYLGPEVLRILRNRPRHDENAAADPAGRKSDCGHHHEETEEME